MADVNRKNLRKRPGGSYAVVYYVPTEFRDRIGMREIVGASGPATRGGNAAEPAILLEISAEVHRLVSPDEVTVRSLGDFQETETRRAVNRRLNLTPYWSGPLGGTAQVK